MRQQGDHDLALAAQAGTQERRESAGVDAVDVGTGVQRFAKLDRAAGPNRVVQRAVVRDGAIVGRIAVNLSTIPTAYGECSMAQASVYGGASRAIWIG